MVSKKQLVKKLHFNEGFDIDKIADILEETESEIIDIVEDLPKYHILTSTSKYVFWKITDNDYCQLRKKSYPIHPMYMFSYDMQRYLKQFELKGIPEIYYVLSYFFGKFSKYYDDYKSSFRYIFSLRIYENGSEDLQGKYIVSITDVKGHIEVEFYKVEEGKDWEEYRTYHEASSDLKEKEMKKIWFWFMAFVKNGIGCIENNNLAIKPFCKTIDYGNVIYGYKNKEFFIEEYIEDQDEVEAADVFNDVYQQYKNKSSEFISEVIKETNKNSIPSYEFSRLKYDIYKVAHGYFKGKDKYDFDELNEKDNSLKYLILTYLAFKDEQSSKEKYFKENNKIRELNFKDFKEVLEKVDKVFKEKGYTNNEIQIILKGYKKGYLEGKKKVELEMVKRSLKQGVEIELLLEMSEISEEEIKKIEKEIN